MTYGFCCVLMSVTNKGGRYQRFSDYTTLSQSVPIVEKLAILGPVKEFIIYARITF
jgi:hypothetical protein